MLRNAAENRLLPEEHVIEVEVEKVKGWQLFMGGGALGVMFGLLVGLAFIL